MHDSALIASILLILISSAGALLSPFSRTTSPSPSSASCKQDLLKRLDDPLGFNQATKQRTALVADMIQENPTQRPGSSKSFAPLAAGTWQIVYAPHIYAMSKLAGGTFNPVQYILSSDGTMTSHARYSFPIIGSGWLSVSGGYGSQDDESVCRVDFNKAWWKPISREQENRPEEDVPYDTLEDVPPSVLKNAIQALGTVFFVEQVSVFPVSYLDNDTIVFDFELLGTRICARKVTSS